MPRKRPVDSRIEEAKERLQALQDEKRMDELKKRIAIRRRRRR